MFEEQENGTAKEWIFARGKDEGSQRKDLVRRKDRVDSTKGADGPKHS
jgi:hypothetical protein